MFIFLNCMRYYIFKLTYWLLREPHCWYDVMWSWLFGDLFYFHVFFAAYKFSCFCKYQICIVPYVTATVRGSEHWKQFSVACSLPNLMAQTGESLRLESILAWSNRDGYHLPLTLDLVRLEMLSISPVF